MCKTWADILLKKIAPLIDINFDLAFKVGDSIYQEIIRFQRYQAKNQPGCLDEL
jgi:hypothetical protein